MLMVIPDEGKLRWLTWALKSSSVSQPDFHLHLFKNDYTPDDDTDIALLTEADFTGYDSVPILRSEMSAPVITAHVAVSTRSSPPEFNCTGGSAQTVYGWYLTADDNDDVLAAQRFDSPRSMSSGSTESIDPFLLKLQTLH
jgi:hypothetical protein